MMRWQQGRRSSNVENRRGRKVAAGGGGVLLVIGLVVALMGGNPTPFISEGLERTIQSRQISKTNLPPEEEKQLVDFVSVVLGSTEDVWTSEYAKQGASYNPPKLVLFNDVVNSACGRAGSSTGPFYCGRDQNIYIDLAFYQDLKSKLNAPGDFAQAYVIAHEVAHHIQNHMGVLDAVQDARRQMSEVQANRMTVRLELQADCFSGIWARKVQNNYNMIESGDIDEALNAASQIGDDRLQKQSQGYVVPDSFTHGTSAQRQRWFKRGFETGSIDACNSFEAKTL
jgi:predicted metalloprotease